MTRQDANFAFDGVAPFNPYVLPMDQVEAMIAAHKAKHPGPYRLTFDPAHMEARRKWLEEMERLDHLKANAIMFGTAPKPRPKIHKGVPIQCQQAAALKNKQAMKTPEMFIAHARASITEMGTEEPGSKRWYILRHQAQNYIGKARARAKRTGEDLPKLPDLPHNPNSKIGRRNVSIDEQITNMAERLARYQTEGKRRNANALKSHVRRLCRESGIDLPECAA